MFTGPFCISELPWDKKVKQSKEENLMAKSLEEF